MFQHGSTPGAMEELMSYVTNGTKLSKKKSLTYFNSHIGNGPSTHYGVGALNRAI